MAARRCFGAVVAALAILALSSPAFVAAQMSTKGVRLAGYTYSTNVEQLLGLHDDSCQIFQAVAAGRPDDARTIFYNGRNALPLTLASLVSDTSGQGRPLYNLLFSGDGTYGFTAPSDLVKSWEVAIESGSAFGTLATTVYAVQGKIMFDYLDKAARSASRNADVQRNLDSAWSIFAGRPSASINCPVFTDMASIYGAFAEVFGNSYRGVPRTLLYTARLFGDAQSLSKNPKNLTASRAAITQATRNIVSVYSEFGLQYILYGALSKDVARACNNVDILYAAWFDAVLVSDVSLSIAKGLGASQASIAGLSLIAGSQAQGYTETRAAVQAVAADINIPYTNLAAIDPSIPALKQAWWVQTQSPVFDVRNCTAI